MGLWPKVRGLMGHTQGRGYVVSGPGDVPGLPELKNLIVVASPRPGGTPAADWAVDATVAPADRILTDAWAPVEYLQAKVFLRGLGWSPRR